MSANAASLRRILRSIGSHATPTTNTLRKPQKGPCSNTRAHSQILGQAAASHHARHGRQRSSVPRDDFDARLPTQTELDGGQLSTGNHQWNNRASNNVRSNKTRSGSDAKRQKSTKPVVNETRETRQPSGGKVSLESSKFLDKADASGKNEAGFHDGYFLQNRTRDHARMKARARRRQLLKERHEHSEEEAWQEILRFLEQASPDEAKAYTKRMETIRLPEGIYAKWMRDPGESILEVMQRTGSHVQVIPGKQIGLFSSLTMLGRPAQNAAAKKLLQESDLLQAVSEDDLNTSKSLADYHLHSEVSDRHGEALKEDEDDDNIKASPSDELDDIAEAQLWNAVATTTGNAPSTRNAPTTRDAPSTRNAPMTLNAPTRAVWSNASRDTEQIRNGRLDHDSLMSKSQSLTQYLASTSVAATSLTARVEELTVDMPRQVRRKIKEGFDLPEGYVRDELVALMTSPDNASSITPLAAGKALQYLAHHMCFAEVRQVLNALKDVKVRPTPFIFNTLLAAAAQNENVLAFHHIVFAMRDRAVTPDPGTWVQFHTLMRKRFPAKSELVITRMHEKAVTADHSARINNLETYSAVLLSSFIEAYPRASVREFVDNMSRDNPGLRWLTTFSVNQMCHHLLNSGNITAAFEAVDELVSRGGQPDAVTLNTFLSAARRDGDMATAVAILRRFHDLDTKSTPLADTTRSRLATLSRIQNLSITLNLKVFENLCNLAWERRQFNCLRVFWRYACCAGHVDVGLIKRLRRSLISKGARDGHLTDIYQRDGDLASRARVWKAMAARFAIGIQSGLDPQHAKRLNDTARAFKRVEVAQSDALSAVRIPGGKRAVTASRLETLDNDLDEVQSLWPTKPLVDLAEKALRRDSAWKDTLVGLPKGLSRYQSMEAMFEMMLRDGVEVPVKIGNAVGMKL